MDSPLKDWGTLDPVAIDRGQADLYSIEATTPRLAIRFWRQEGIIAETVKISQHHGWWKLSLEDATPCYRFDAQLSTGLHTRSSTYWKASLQGCLAALGIWPTPRHSATGEVPRRSARLCKGGLHGTQSAQHLWQITGEYYLIRTASIRACETVMQPTSPAW